MFTQKITNSARFLKMSPSAQSLYFHLGMHADDDGVVEAFTIMQLINAAEDDFKILVAKSFIKPLNDDLVSYILDWREHNTIRADRKIDSRYKDLLVQILPDVELVKAKPRSDVEDNSTRVGTDQPRLEDPKIIKHTPEDMECVDLLVSLIKKNNEEWDMKGKPEKWAEDINKLFRIDGRSYKQIQFMIRWTQQDQFWSQNILSASKLREKFNDLIPKIKAQANKQKAHENNTVFS
jgi:hypothetical protein